MFKLYGSNQRDYRVGWLLLSVETEANGGGLKSTYEQALPWLVCWARCASLSNFYPALAALVDPELTVQFFSSFDPIAQQAG